jgi:arginine-tRNA-protein transferase
VDVARFQPDRSQRRVCAKNAADVRLHVRPPSLSFEHLHLYDRYHTYQSGAKGWPPSDADPGSYYDAFVDNPFPTEEWAYELDGRLIGIGYVDVLPVGLSAIYFYYEPALRDRSLGTWNILSLIARAATLALPHVYLGYFVASCSSMAYKARFQPHERLFPDGAWREVRD